MSCASAQPSYAMRSSQLPWKSKSSIEPPNAESVTLSSVLRYGSPSIVT